MLAPWKPFFQANIIIFQIIQDEKCPAPAIFELIQDIIGTNLLTKFHDDRKINVISRVLIRKIAPVPVVAMFFNQPGIIFTLAQDIIRMNLLTEFHEDQTINVASRVLTRFYYSLTYWTINVASRVLTKFYESTIKKNAPPPGGHVFQPTGIIFELVQDIIGMNLLTKKNAPPLGSHVFQAKVTIFKLIKDISGTNLLSKFHEDRKINVTSRVKNAPPLGSHVFQANVTIFELIHDIIETNLLTKLHEDWTINVASRE
ncbi:hypothetical protein DPMN_015145 [Dreissena polymorpha]|uniref:Uncharacterized protein n=1 Tax=Dreissena polymorpha TaxID=45954 RepID=A0A9D4NC46_DREPO|nr:hypothetical protein DPMN_015145 [Dreissena polymorpha]